MSVEAQWRIKEWFADLDERCLERLRIYHIELLRWTKTVNLISASTVEDADRIHFTDCLIGAKSVLGDLPEIKELWDIGSGNGMPGVVFSILRPELGVICVESDERKAAFLKQLALRLELDNLGVRGQRAENLPSGSLQIVCARGFASIDKATLMLDKQFSGGGIFYHFKGPDYKSEVSALKKVSTLKWNTSILSEYRLPLVKVIVDGVVLEKNESRFIVKLIKQG